MECMNRSEVEAMDILEEHDHSSNHRPKEEGMDITGIHIVEVDVWIW
jgi:hypothetical protein